MFLKGIPNGEKHVYTLLESGALPIAFDLAAEVENVVALADKYKDTPMYFADACLVRMSEFSTWQEFSQLTAIFGFIGKTANSKFLLSFQTNYQFFAS